mmetsp:Transcript_32612/g.51968  ORF Transcript_32612/g.51968 Transcript_32612/m.51968 type:complete len:91 (+) Transcript_32612:4039-4311(+)
MIPWNDGFCDTAQTTGCPASQQLLGAMLANVHCHASCERCCLVIQLGVNNACIFRFSSCRPPPPVWCSYKCQGDQTWYRGLLYTVVLCQG